MEKKTWKERFSYWFDNRMAKGSLALIRILFIATVILILVVTLIITLLKLSPEMSFGETLWESLSTVINAWMPSSGDGSIGYIIMMALAAIGGLFVTSILIGIISTAIEEKVTDLKRGRSKVLEEGHTVILGIEPGEFTLIRQLILSASGDPMTIVVADEMESDELKQMITDNVEIPKNIKLICRQTDIFDPVSLGNLMIPESRSVIIHPQDDRQTVKALLAVSNIIYASQNDKTRISAIISRKEYRLPSSIAMRHNITALQTDTIMAKLIAHACTQSGLSMTFSEVFNYEGSEFCPVAFQNLKGLTFLDVLINTDCGTPAGVCRDGKILLNPEPDLPLEDNDQILVFTEDKHAAKIEEILHKAENIDSSEWVKEETMKPNSVTIIGYNTELKTVVHELPEDVTEILIAGIDEDQKELVKELIIDERDRSIEFYPVPLKTEEVYKDLAMRSKHVAILSDYEKDKEDADMEVIFHILYLRDYRNKYGLDFNITAEMCLERNETLISTTDNTDYIVTSSMSALFLAQLSESPELISVFTEILSNEGNELFIKTAEEMNCMGTVTARKVRQILAMQGCIFLGLLTEGENGQECEFNPGLDRELELDSGSKLIVLCDN